MQLNGQLNGQKKKDVGKELKLLAYHFLHVTGIFAMPHIVE